MEALHREVCMQQTKKKMLDDSNAASARNLNDNPARPGSFLLPVPKDFIMQLEDVFGPLMPNDNLSTGSKIEISLAEAKSIYNILGSCIQKEEQYDLKKAAIKRKQIVNKSSAEKKKIEQGQCNAIKNKEDPIPLSKIMKMQAADELHKDKATDGWSKITPEARMFRHKAADHYEMEKLCRENSRKYRDMHVETVADAYAADARDHRLKMEAANKIASDLILRHNNIGLDYNDLDLHGLLTEEAITAL